MNGTALRKAVSNIALKRVTALLGTGHCTNGVRDPGGEEDFQPDRPLKMVIFRLSDCLLGEEQLATLAEIAQVLLNHGADPKPAVELAETRYGPYSKEDEKWKARSIVVAAAAAEEHADEANFGHGPMHASTVSELEPEPDGMPPVPPPPPPPAPAAAGVSRSGISAASLHEPVSEC